MGGPSSLFQIDKKNNLPRRERRYISMHDYLKIDGDRRVHRKIRGRRISKFDDRVAIREGS